MSGDLVHTTTLLEPWASLSLSLSLSLNMLMRFVLTR